MATEFGTGKTIFILAIVVGCFAILWPKIFYPMLQSSVSPKPSTIPTADCCDVIFEKDLNAIKIMSQLCEKILSGQSHIDKRFLLAFQQGRLTKEIVNKCNSEVHEKCNVDIAEFLKDKVRLGRTYQQMLNELRSLNSSLCLKINFGISPALIGAPRRFRVWETKHLRQERPPHLRPHMLHPALREKGRAIPHSHIVPRVVEKEPPATPMPMPGMRPPMGGAGHVVPPPKTGGTMGIIMPLYTIGIVIFFMYTMMKLIFKKSDESSAYKDFEPDPEFRRVVFADTPPPAVYQASHHADDNTKLVVSAISGLVAEVNRDILSKKASADHTEEAEDILAAEEEAETEEVKEPQAPEKVEEVVVEETKVEVEDKEIEREVQMVEVTKVEMEDKEIERGVQVVGMEMTESLEGGHKWSRPPTPLTPRSGTPTIPPPPPPEPQSIYLEGSLPSQSQLLVSQSEIERLSQESDESPVILAGKVTLSLIGLDALRDNGGPEITMLSDEEEEEEEEDEDEGIVQVSEDEAEAVDHVNFNGDEDMTTNYTTASAAGGHGDETAADISTMEPHQDEDQESEEELEEDSEEEEIVIKPQISATASKPVNDTPVKAKQEEVEEEEEEEEEVEEEEDEELEEEEEVGRPQSLLRQHQR